MIVIVIIVMFFFAVTDMIVNTVLCFSTQYDSVTVMCFCCYRYDSVTIICFCCYRYGNCMRCVWRRTLKRLSALQEPLSFLGRCLLLSLSFLGRCLLPSLSLSRCLLPSLHFLGRCLLPSLVAMALHCIMLTDSV